MPYVRTTFGNAGEQRLRTGLNWELGDEVALGIEAAHASPDTGAGQSEFRLPALPESCRCPPDPADPLS